jgi:HAD superfamily hydrolase (TIGR01509 family)
MLPDCLRAVCFDIGGVLTRMPRGPLAEELAGILGADPERIRCLLIDYGKRQRTSPRALARIVAPQSEPRELALVEEALLRRQNDIATPDLYPDGIPALEALITAGWRVCFLSNAVGSSDHQQHPDYYSFAETVVHSWEIGHCKPDVEAFRAVEHRMRLAPHEIVNVGDSIRSDVVGAAAAGWSSIHLARQDGSEVCTRSAARISTLLDLPALLPNRNHR